MEFTGQGKMIVTHAMLLSKSVLCYAEDTCASLTAPGKTSMCYLDCTKWMPDFDLLDKVNEFFQSANDVMASEILFNLSA